MVVAPRGLTMAQGNIARRAGLFRRQALENFSDAAPRRTTLAPAPGFVVFVALYATLGVIAWLYFSIVDIGRWNSAPAVPAPPSCAAAASATR
jgi:hypothetical protein